MTLRIFIGVDPRQPLAYTVLNYSIARHCSQPVSITPLMLSQLPIKRRGLTEFTYSRFLVPWLCGYQGLGLFLDADMVVRDDITHLFGQADYWNAVQVMQEQPRFEWPSLMLFNCAHSDCKKLTPAFIDDPKNPLLDLAWTERIGAISPNWNRVCGYPAPVPIEDASLLHLTQGIACWPETRGGEGADEWLAEFREAVKTCSWSDLMGRSVHAPHVLARFEQVA